MWKQCKNSLVSILQKQQRHYQIYLPKTTEVEAPVLHMIKEWVNTY